MEETEINYQKNTFPNDITWEMESLTVTSKTEPGGAMSPTTSKNLDDLMNEIRRGEASIRKNGNGENMILYKKDPEINRMQNREKSKFTWDPHNVSTMDTSEQNLNNCTEKWMNHIAYIQENKPTFGVNVDNNIVKPVSGMYRKGSEFQESQPPIKYGEHVEVCVDKETGQKFLSKTIEIDKLSKSEIYALIALKDSGTTPGLYRYQIKADYKIEIFMEAILEEISFQDLRRKCKKHFPVFIKIYALYTLHKFLEAIIPIHTRGWAHKDIHEDNVLIQKCSERGLKFIITDLGEAEKMMDEQKGLDLCPFRKDIADIMRLFSSFLFKNWFVDADEVQTKWEQKLREEKADDDIFELFEKAMKIFSPKGVPQFQSLVESKLTSALHDAGITTQDMIRDLVCILYPDYSDDDPKIDNLQNGPNSSRDVAQSRRDDPIDLRGQHNKMAKKDYFK